MRSRATSREARQHFVAAAPKTEPGARLVPALSAPIVFEMLTYRPDTSGQQGISFETTLQKSVECGLLWINSEGAVSNWNPDAAAILSLPNAGAKISFETLPIAIQSAVREARQTRRIIADRKIALSDSDEATLSAMPIESGASTPGVVVAIKKFSDATRVGDSLRQLDRLSTVGMLSACMAHEIKNALVAVKTFADLLLEKKQETELAGIVRREMDRVDAIVSQMLKFSAPSRRTLSPLRLHELLDHSLRLVRHRVEHKFINFSREFNALPDGFAGDKHQLEQAFLNLLFNAVEAIGEEGSVSVSTEMISGESDGQLREGERAPRMLQIKISDTGSGITAENLNHMFEPFFTTKQNGTGLGLAVTRRIIEEHNGSIRVESAPDAGTTFVVLLPAGFKV
ncbi:MAG TPA: ATP-binding protein [Verrucomicrobiae bacterium]|nr:ATP-binding protein [Verrucomicrobiae bacterium]